MSKTERAKALIEKARALGCEPVVQGSWVVFKPPLPVDLLLEASEIGDALADALK